ncbi:MAG: glycosyltransferase family 2 protein [Candidatus Omnitrophica bacterium]|nr:glycosyltransferase family 2 protein [Candidatus Omnitrophota bacterium]
MKFEFSRQTLDKRERNLQRFFEIIPAATSWSIIVGMLCVSFWKPLLAAILIIAFDLYWLMRLFYMVIFLVISYIKMGIEKKTNWLQRIDDIDHLQECLERTKKQRGLSLKERRSLVEHYKRLEVLWRSKNLPSSSKEIYHLVVLPILKESPKIIESTVTSLTRGNPLSKKILVVLAVEDRASEDTRTGAYKIQSEFKRDFLDFLIVMHPDGLPYEARVKGANVSFAARHAAEYLKGKGISFGNVIVSCFDADTVVDRNYFPCLTYNFMICPDRNQASFQPIPVYHNNIWDVPAFARVLDVGSSFFQLIESTNPASLVTFSSHSMSFKALVDVGYWPIDLISDDSAIFWKSFIHFDGDYRVVPLYITVSMDVADAGSWRKTFLNVYRQKRRWAWGVENYPIVMRAFLRAKKIPLIKRFKHAFKLFEGHVSWASWPFLLGVISWFPAFFAGREFSSTVIYYSAPRIKATIFNLASLGLLTTSVLSVLLLPRFSIRYNWLRKIGHFFEWLLVPIISIFLSAVPALDAQTRLMLGRYMEFWVTEKKRK